MPVDQNWPGVKKINSPRGNRAHQLQRAQEHANWISRDWASILLKDESQFGLALYTKKQEQGHELATLNDWPHSRKSINSKEAV